MSVSATDIYTRLIRLQVRIIFDDRISRVNRRCMIADLDKMKTDLLNLANSVFFVSESEFPNLN